MDEIVPTIESILTPTLETEIFPEAQKEFQSAFAGTIEEWAATNIDLPKVTYKPSGPFNVNLSRHFIRPFQQLKNRSIRQVNIMASPRSGKTLVGEIFLLNSIALNPGNAAWVQASGEVMDRMTSLRIHPLMKMCPSVKKLLNLNDRTALTQKHAKFSNNMTVEFVSATPNSFLGVGYRYVIFDEVWRANAGLIGHAQSRIGDFPDYKILLISQGGDEKHPEWEEEFNRAPIWEWGWTCPECQTVQVLEFNKRREVLEFNKRRDDDSYSGLQWDRNEKTYDFNRRLWHSEEAADSCRLECSNSKCKSKLYDTTANRDDLNNKGLYVCTKPEGNPDNESIRWNALADRKVAWKKLAYEFCEAYNLERKTGVVTLKAHFRQQREAKSWGSEYRAPVFDILIENYEPASLWQLEEDRILSVDMQRLAPQFWFVVRSWAKNEESRKLEHGFCNSWDEIEDLRKKWGIKYNRVIVDAGDGVNTATVYTECAKRGDWFKDKLGNRRWVCYLATHGDKGRMWPHKKSKDTVLWLPWKPETRQPAKLPNLPKYSGVLGCPFVLFSDFNLSTTLEHLLKGRGAKFVCGPNNDDEYEKQLRNFQRIEILDGKKRTEKYIKLNETEPNEYFDCEKLQCLGASMGNILTTVRVSKQATDKINVKV